MIRTKLTQPQAESKALHNISGDSTKLLTEKLELTRELSTLKPEIEYLRAEMKANEGILAEKLGLQRQLSTMQVELAHAKKEAERALAKRRNTTFDLAQDDQMDELRKAVKREQRLREKAEEAAESAQADLDRERKSNQKKSVKDAKKVEQDAHVEAEAEELRQQLAREKKEHEKIEKALQKAQGDWEAQRSILDDKLNQFRTKLKSTKEKLKEAETELEQAKAAAAAKPAAKATTAQPAAKPANKRNAAQMDTDATALGTPGDGKPAKRNRKAAAGVGDKSTFSITPFLNRTMSVAAESPDDKADGDDASEVEQSPTISRATSVEPSAKPKSKPLAPIPASKTNVKKAAAPRKKVTMPALEKVTEEDETSQGQENAGAAKPALKAKQAQDGKPKMRKSLAAFATFNLEPEPEKKKKRKLGGLGKTLFDEEEESAPAKPMPGLGLFGGARGFGPLAGLKGGLLGNKGVTKGKLRTAEDGSGFQFSPLKRDKRMMSFLK